MKQSSEGLLSQPQINEHVAETKGLKKATKAAQKRARHEGTEAKSYSWSLMILPFFIFKESLQGKRKGTGTTRNNKNQLRNNSSKDKTSRTVRLRWEKSKHMTKDHGDKKNIFPLAVCQVGRLLMENTLELIYKADILSEGYQN